MSDAMQIKKTSYRWIVIPLSLLSCNAMAEEDHQKNPEYVLFGKDVLLNRPYSHTLGWSLSKDPIWGEPGAEFYERTTTPVIPNDVEVGSIEYKKQKLLVEMISADDMKKRRLDTQLAIGTLNEKDHKFVASDGAAILLRLRDSFQLFNDASPGFEFQYTQTDGQEDLSLKGALMADIYLPYLYSSDERVLFNNWFENPHRIWFRTGVEFDRGEESERTSYYFLASMYANPDQLFSIFDKIYITSPQLIQFGVAFDDDSLTDTQDTRFLISWQPALYLQNGLSIKDLFSSAEELEAKVANGERNVASGFGINHKMYYQCGSFGTLFSPFHDRGTCEQSPLYAYIPCDLSLSDSSEVIKSALNGEGFGGASLEWHAGLGFGHDLHKWRLTYLCEGESPVKDLGESRIAHSVSFDFTLGLLDRGDDANTDDIFSGVTLTAKYITGEFGDEPDKQDQFTVGTKVRF